jgi:hypothetical protein
LFNGLSEHDQEMLRKALTEAVDSALFGLFTVVDGVRTIEVSPYKSEFEFYYVKGKEKKLLIIQMIKTCIINLIS